VLHRLFLAHVLLTPVRFGAEAAGSRRLLMESSPKVISAQDLAEDLTFIALQGDVVA
jgi:hypothetical protein